MQRARNDLAPKRNDNRDDFGLETCVTKRGFYEDRRVPSSAGDGK
jgi:hypothetical protein